MEILVYCWSHCIIYSHLASRSINRTYIRPINEVTYATSLLADGYYHVRVQKVM